MTFASLQHYYSGSWVTENSNQAYTLALQVVAALEQSKCKEFNLLSSAGKLYVDHGIVLEKNGVVIPVPTVRAQYIIGNDLTIAQGKGKDIKDAVEKALGRK